MQWMRLFGICARWAKILEGAGPPEGSAENSEFLADVVPISTDQELHPYEDLTFLLVYGLE